MAEKCAICDGGGDYPIIDNLGVERYCITCPECHGSGEEYDDPEPEPTDLPPASSAAFIKSMDHLREHVRRYWAPPSPQEKESPHE